MTDYADYAEAADATEHSSDSIDLQGISRDRLRTIVERIERLEEERAGLATDIKEIYAEAKGEGFDVKIVRQIIARRKKDRDELAEQDELLSLYLAALDE